MISKPRHPFWIEYMEVMRANKDNVVVVVATGPNALKETIVRWYGGRCVCKTPRTIKWYKCLAHNARRFLAHHSSS
jgi:hypothetical protein